MFSTNTDMGRYLAAMVTRPSAIVIANTPTTMGTIAATSAPNATMSTTSVIGEGAGEGLLEEVGGAGRLGGFVAPAPQCEHLLDAAGSRREEQRERRPCRDDPAAPADEEGRGEREQLLCRHAEATIIERPGTQS